MSNYTNYSIDMRERMMLAIPYKAYITFETQNVTNNKSTFYNLMNNLSRAKPDPLITIKKLDGKRNKYIKTIIGALYTQMIQGIREAEQRD